jgi:hypothetical protein
MPRYVVHIGPPKTGSKYLQSMLFQARQALLAKGICYPDNWWTRPTQTAHDTLFEWLRAGRFAEVEATFREIAAQNHNVVVISSEALEHLTPEQFEKLRDSMGSNPVDIVYYCRRWSDHIPSSWKQAIKTGLYPTLPEYYLAAVRHARYTASINFSLIWNTVCGAFGRDSLKLVSYSNLRDDHVDIFHHFARTFLEWHDETAVLKDALLENVSPNAVDTEILRALNWIDFRAKGRHLPDMYVRFSARRLELDTHVFEKIMANSIAEFELNDGAEEFRLSWNDMNLFADCLVPQSSSRESIFEFRTVSVPYVKADYLFKEGAAGELQNLYRRLNDAVHEGMYMKPIVLA